MMLYLTGADTSLSKSPEAIQNDPSKSLGGYISSSLVPNGEVNALFDLISSYTLEKRNKETIALGLINRLNKPVTNVTLKIVIGNDDLVSFKVAATNIGENYSMESIPNRYSEPMMADFYKADFQRAFVDIQINSPARVGEEITFYPFEVTAVIEEEGIEGTLEAIEDAFNDSEDYEAEIISEKIIRIRKTDEEVIKNTIKCSYDTDYDFSAEFLGEFKNGVTNEVTLIGDGDLLYPNQAIGLWIQRNIKKHKFPSNQKIIEDWKNKIIKSKTEQVEIVISYIIDDNKKYSENYNNDYSKK